MAAMAAGVREIAALPDPVGEVLDGFRLPNGLDVRKVRVPLGVVAVVYEARPNVTIDAAALALKSGNAVVLRGSSSAAHSNAVLAAVAVEAVEAAGLPAGSLSLVAGGGREELAELAGQEGVVDLIIPRGGEGLKKALSAVAKVPGDLRGVGQLPRLRRRERRPRARARRSCSTPRRSARASATRPRRCSCTRPSRREFLPRRARRAARRGRRAARRRGASRALDGGVTARRDRGRLGGGVPRARARGEGRRLGRGGDRARQPLRLRATPRRSSPATRRPRGRSSSASTPPACTSTPRRASPTAASSGWAPRSATRRRSCTPAARSALRELCTFKYLVEGDGQIRAVARWRASGCSAGRSTRRTSATSSARRRRWAQLGLDRVLLVPVHTPPHKEADGDPGVEHRVALCEARRGRRRAARRLARRGRRAGALVHGRYPLEAP